MRELKLGDIADIITGPFGSQLHMEDYVNEGVPVVMPQNIKARKVDEKGIARISEYDYMRLRKYATMKNDMVYARRGDIEKHAFIENDNKMLCGTGCLRIRVKDSDVLPLYLSFYLCSPEARKELVSHAIGTNMQNLNTGILSEVPVKLPPYEKQAIIADFLHKLESKIKLNQKINDYLEEMAKTIYDYWFVQFDFPDENDKPYKSSGGKMVNANGHIIPEGWTFCKVKDIISNICTGLNPRDNFKLGTGAIKYITVKNLTTNGTLDFTGCDTIDEFARAIVHNRSNIQIGDILFASIAPLGRCYLIQSEPTDWDINESVFSIRANTALVTPAFLYLYFMSDAFIKHATSSSTGSIFKGIRINTLLETELCVPPLSVILKFEDCLASTFPLKSKNYEEIQRLSNLRDWLLPMLMNGQATIED